MPVPWRSKVTRSKARRGLRARRDGRFAEYVCALWLMAKGYRLLGFRLRTPQGEIDILARKGALIVVVEVKRRATMEAALQAIGWRQRESLRRAAENLAGRSSSLRGLPVRLDLIALAPGRWPRHIRGAWGEV